MIQLGSVIFAFFLNVFFCTHIIICRGKNRLLGQAAALERILPLDILSFWHNIDFRGEAAGGSLVTFHITSEIYAESVCTNRGWGMEVGGQGLGGEEQG